MKHLLSFVCLFVVLLGVPSFACAQDHNAEQPPLEISADETLEWNRAAQTFIARGNALAEQGDVSIRGALLTAFYHENETSNFDLYNMMAEGGVVINSADNQAFGDKAIYALDKDYAELTGDDLRIVTPEQTISARDKFEYFASKGEFKATGAAQIIRPQDTLSADVITARMYTNKKGQRVLSKVVAQGDVRIETAQEQVTGDRGVYDAKKNSVTLTGDVFIRRGINVLQGARAVVDLDTQVSKLYGKSRSNNQKGRVTGTFYPDTMKK